MTRKIIRKWRCKQKGCWIIDATVRRDKKTGNISSITFTAENGFGEKAGYRFLDEEKEMMSKLYPDLEWYEV